MNERSEARWWPIAPVGAASALLRLSLGVLFFFAGLGKFLREGGAVGFGENLVESFSDTYLPRFLLIPFSYGLPYIEVVLGALLILGIRTREVLAVTGLLLINLAFGQILKHEYGTVANNFNYVLIAAAGLWLAGQDNRYSVDHFLPGAANNQS